MDWWNIVVLVEIGLMLKLYAYSSCVHAAQLLRGRRFAHAQKFTATEVKFSFILMQISATEDLA